MKTTTKKTDSTTLPTEGAPTLAQRHPDPQIHQQKSEEIELTLKKPTSHTKEETENSESVPNTELTPLQITENDPIETKLESGSVGHDQNSLFHSLKEALISGQLTENPTHPPPDPLQMSQSFSSSFAPSSMPSIKLKFSDSIEIKNDPTSFQPQENVFAQAPTKTPIDPKVQESYSFLHSPTMEKPHPISSDDITPSIKENSEQSLKALKNEPSPTYQNYIKAKEDEVAFLKANLKKYHETVEKLTHELKTHLETVDRKQSEIEKLKKFIEHLKNEIQNLNNKHQSEIEALKEENQKNIVLKGEIQALEQRKEEFKQKVKEDLMRIKLKEKELENKYELLRRDSEELLESKDKQLLLEKSKNDALRLDIDNLNEQLSQQNEALKTIDDKREKIEQYLESLLLVVKTLGTK